MKKYIEYIDNFIGRRKAHTGEGLDPKDDILAIQALALCKIAEELKILNSSRLPTGVKIVKYEGKYDGKFTDDVDPDSRSKDV